MRRLFHSEPAKEGAVGVQYGRNALFLAPEDPDALFRDLAQRLSLRG